MTGFGTIQLGSPVLYKLQNGPSAGQYRPAIITRTWENDGKDPQSDPNTSVQLMVFLDLPNDGSAEGFVSSAKFDDNSSPNGTWKWPVEKIL